MVSFQSVANYKTMGDFKRFLEKVQNVQKTNFEEIALEIFQFQAESNPLYRNFLRARKILPQDVKGLDQLPFLPIEFFKNHPIISGSPKEFEGYFSSSGTTGMMKSKHYYWSREWYLDHTVRLFEQTYGSLDGFHVLALLPSYLEREGSSLVAMAERFIQRSNSPHSGFYLYEQDALLEKLKALNGDSRKVLLLGVTFALLDLAESEKPFEMMGNLIVMETGGMKGMRKEMIREEVHAKLCAYFKLDLIHSEYGMTELMSQAYSKGGGRYTIPACMHVMLRDINDPYSLANRSQGGINVIDLGNFHSCAFLETQDLGKIHSEGSLEVLGRMDNSDVRGCNLLVGF